jgi:hypothetical protein
MEKIVKNVVGSSRTEVRDKRYKSLGEKECKMVCRVEKNRTSIEGLRKPQS